MTIQFSTLVRNAMLDAIETTAGASTKLRILSGAQPANCAAAQTGTLLADLTLPADWMSNSSNGAKALLGTWQDGSADAAGTASYYRIVDSAGTTCHVQGSITATGGGGDMTLDNVTIAVGQAVTITAYGYTAPNA
jgi:hypothetical protein